VREEASAHRRRSLSVTGALVLYGADAPKAAAGKLISHAIALLMPIVIGGVAFALLPRAIAKERSRVVKPPAVVGTPEH
jgi:hypothetical protein